jgi:cytoskeletal protein CcmA (bactofilin family)
MFQKPYFRVLLSGLLITLLLVGFASSAKAFEGQGGDSVQIAAGQTVNDNLYVGAKTFTLDGTVNGDVFAAGETMTINGKVDGDVMATGQTVIINGTVNGDVRMAAGALYMGENAKVSGDVVAFGGSLETRKGGSIGKDMLFYGGQALLSGDIGRNLRAGTGGLKIDGKITGNVDAEVGDATNAGPSPSSYLPQVSVPLPIVPPGLNIAPTAKIGGKLVYTSSKELSFPAGLVAGGIQYLKPVVKPEDVVVPPTLSEQIMTGIFDALRRMVTLILFGLFLAWLFPAFLKKTSDNIQSAALPMLGWGIVSWAAFFFAVLVLIVATIVGAMIFGILTLGSVSGVIVWLGILALFILIIGFVLAVSFVAPIIVSSLGGKLILARVKPEWSEHKAWPVILGVVILAALSALPFLGWLINLLAVLLGLGALWVWGRAALKTQQQPVV